jgi:hypothetical protein
VQQQTWKRIYLVLRPNLLSIYRDHHETKLRHKIHLSELTAVAFLKDPKQKRQNVFGLFSPSRNYHLEAKSKQDAEEWVELIRQEARIEEEEEEMFLASPGGNATGTYTGFERAMEKQREAKTLHDDRLGTSSPEPSDPLPRRISKVGTGPLGPQRRVSHTFEYSGNEMASHSDMSEGETQREIGASTISIPIPEETSTDDAIGTNRPIKITRNASQMSGFNTEQDPERVIWQGYLMYLKSSKGVKQWKGLWAVLRSRNFALYKDDAEYSPRLIIPLSSVINVVEIDPVSKTKIHCMQVITEEKSYRFCAHNEETLDNSLGAFKSLLAKRKEKETEVKRPAVAH